ncbi:uncharacterized protein DUF4190 [Asanoa ferruginea]|uniref:Uncharacterized protein DUF4190 n=1 Tax=Asanoa ferruginea TaxID=53367 RepID=A0A3D9ZJ11_9ACTN|nr:DUF4190 domain-containing protein [Asanoa ferruginea]REF96839.1 uncharacterized protein DUF4190 [Asanoa ferruginea]GIF51030.1 hypothetical protein Afe04nite_55690 [Asanoa ferruginea]
MSYPPPGSQPDPYQPGQPYDPQQSGPPSYGPPVSGQPAPGQPIPGQPTSGQPEPYGQSNPYGQPPDPYAQPNPYGQPDPYAQAYPGYGQQQPAYGYPQARGTNILAILSLVFAFVFAPAGIVLGHLAKKQLRTSGEEGGGLATAGLVLSYVFTGLAVLFCCGIIGLGWFSASTGDTLNNGY